MMAKGLRRFTELFSNFCIALGKGVLIKTIGALPLVVEVVILTGIRSWPFYEAQYENFSFFLRENPL